LSYIEETQKERLSLFLFKKNWEEILVISQRKIEQVRTKEIYPLNFFENMRWVIFFFLKFSA